MSAAQARLGPDNTLQALTFAPTGSTTVEGKVAGYASPVYAVALAAGQTLALVFESPSDNLYFNVVDAADGSGAAVFRGEMEGRTASLKSDAGATYLIMPFQPRATARRGETASYTIKVDRR
ncbi:MAG: hypothetical protein U1C74_30435 [Phenylobacterium sp.]|nr:hypothetical protein [Phenylobacterium sp.]